LAGASWLPERGKSGIYPNLKEKAEKQKPTAIIVDQGPHFEKTARFWHIWK